MSSTNTKTRPPIIVVLGHVDHGKTTLLDYIRSKYVEKARPIAGREAGGITQSIGAYEIKRNNEKMTFIDTPGHEAFSLMRTCGAEVADIAILLIAANDSVKPQTKEAFECIKTAKIPYVVAFSKTDLPEANIEKTKSDLAALGVYLEGQGGDISFQEISAKSGDGVEDLLDLLSLTAEVEGFAYDETAPAEGFVLTSSRDPRRGIQVGVVLKNGTLSKKSAIATKSTKGTIRVLDNFLGEEKDSLRPSAPALILGFENIPKSGEIFFAGENIEEVKKLLEKTKDKKALTHEVKTAAGENVLNTVIKADESGSLEALKGIVSSIAKENENLHIVNAGVGNITETDIKALAGSNAIVIGFRSKVDKAAENLAQGQHIRICTSDIIYELEDQIRGCLQDLLRNPSGVLEVLAVFGERKGESQVVGGKVTKGIIKNQSAFEIWKEDEKRGDGKIKNLQTGKEDAAEITEGNECGMLIESTVAIEQGNELRFFEE